jgi:sugar O-acyltransferase (sialic acid O-acetyltransferase NeuD family)
MGLPLVPFDQIERAFPPEECAMLVAVGYHELNQLRARKCAEAKAKGYRLSSYVSPRSWPGRNIAIGENCMVLDGVTVQPGVTVGNDVWLWSGVVLGHHSAIADHAWLAAGTTVGGGARIGSSCFVGLNATIGNEVDVGSDCIIGAASLVTKSQPAGSVILTKEAERIRLDSQRFLRISRLK